MVFETIKNSFFMVFYSFFGCFRLKKKEGNTEGNINGKKRLFWAFFHLFSAFLILFMDHGFFLNKFGKSILDIDL